MKSSFNNLFKSTIVCEKNKFSNYALAALMGVSTLGGNTVDAKTPASIERSIGQYTLSEQRNIIARTLWAEARNDGELGMRAVASVIYNRANGQIPNMIPVIKKRKQFSCWNGMTESDWNNLKIKEKSGSIWKIANIIASEMLMERFTPTTKANHYYNANKCNPDWSYDKSGNLRPFKMIGSHRFMSI